MIFQQNNSNRQNLSKYFLYSENKSFEKIFAISKAISKCYLRKTTTMDQIHFNLSMEL